MTSNNIEKTFQLTDSCRVACDRKPSREGGPLARMEVVLLNQIAVMEGLRLFLLEEIDMLTYRDSTSSES